MTAVRARLPVKSLTFLLLSCALGLSGCSSNNTEFAYSSEELFYNEGIDSLELSNWPRAIAIFQQLEAQFPFGLYAAQAQIELVYAYYRNGEPEAARAAADRFIRLHPDHPNIDYAYYMKGMSFYTEDQRVLGRYLPTDPSKRDVGQARESFSDFAQLLSRFPDSPYAPDARARMVYLRNVLAAYEVHVAEFYIERQAYMAALNRARYVVENFQRTPSVPKALEIMTEMYLRLGLNNLADTSLAILSDNYPDSPRLNEDGDFMVPNQITDPSFLYVMSFGLLGSNKKEATLAPTRRPPRATPTEEAEVVVQAEEKRSWLNILTLGLLGNRGSGNSVAP